MLQNETIRKVSGFIIIGRHILSTTSSFAPFNKSYENHTKVAGNPSPYPSPRRIYLVWSLISLS